MSKLPARVIKKCQPLDFAHEIILCPIQLFDSRWIGWTEIAVPTLVLCPDELSPVVGPKAEAMGFKLGTTPYSDLSDEQLAEHWRGIHRAFASSSTYLGREPRLSVRLDAATTELPLRMLGRQLGSEREPTVDPDLEALAQDAYWEQTVLAATAALEEERVGPEEVSRRMDETLENEARTLQVPLVVSVPGVPSRYARNAYARFSPSRHAPIEPVDGNDTWTRNFQARPDTQIERATLEFVTAHRAMAATGVGLMLPEIPQPAFNALAQLEDHFRGEPQPQVVWRLLGRVSDSCASIWTDAFKAAIPRSSYLTAFTNFPIGLLRFSERMDPLGCHVPIAYRPTLPLTRTLQHELESVPPIYFGDGFRVLIAECIQAHDPVGQLSRAGWEFVVRHLNRSDAISIKHVETDSTARLRAQIEEEQPHILVLSAHGHYLERANSAALVIGDEVCLGQELGPQPPVVLLSACTVAPRGAGEVTIADLLLREGAVAVLGAQIPVGVRHNAMLMMRFLTYALESQARHEPEVTLLDVWHRASTSNAVNDILSGNRHLRRWGYETPRERGPAIKEFMQHRSVNRLRRGHVYSDTEQVLGEMADDDGLGDRVRNWFRNPGYIPESLFYAFIGRPDRVTLREPIQLSAAAWEAIRSETE